MDLNHKISWKVSLSNGETLYEHKGSFIAVAGELSPWQKLIKYITVNRLEIRSLALTTTDGRTYNLPSISRNPKFKPFADAPQPLDFNVFRSIAREHSVVNMKVEKSKISEWFTVAEAIYPDYKLQIWVDELNPRNSWVLVAK